MQSSLLLAFLLASSGPASAESPGRIVEGLQCPSDPSQTYTLYLPSTYTRSRRWPLLLVFDPRGRGTTAAEVFRDAAERFEWIVVSSDNTRSDGPWEPNRRALAALWPYVLNAYSVDTRRVYAAGFSGGATVAWVLARGGGALAGIIATGAPSPADDDVTPGRVAWFGSAGTSDFNFLAARARDARMAQAGIPHRLEFFDGLHQWMTPDVAQLAVGWLELLAMKDGLRARDEELASRVLAEEFARVERLLSSGRLVDARRALASIVDSYAGLLDVGDATNRIRQLDGDERLAQARREEQRGDDRERALIASARTILARLRTDEAPLAQQFVAALNISGLHKIARRADYEGEGARRVLETIFVQTAMYIPQLFEEQREFARAAVSLEVAAAIHPDRPMVWVNLAGARAMSGSKKPAISALSRAIEAGFRNQEVLANDPRFASLRGTAEFARVLDALAAK